MVRQIGTGQSDWARQYMAREERKRAGTKITDMFGQMGEQSQAAEAANVALFGQMGEQSRGAQAASATGYEEMLGLAGQTSGQRTADIEQSAAGQRATIAQQQARLGMSGTTVGTTLGQGVGRWEQAEKNRLADQMLGRQLEIKGGGLAAGERFAGQQIGITGQQAAAGERFAGQRTAMMGQQVGMQQAGNAAFLQAQAQIEAARLGAAPGMMAAQGQRAKMEQYRKLTRPSVAG